MFLLEHDAKTLLALRHAPVPRGVLLEEMQIPADLPPGPWMIKAQIAAGGRGKAGLIRAADTRDALMAHLRFMLGTVHKGLTVRACRVESSVDGAAEAYASLMLDPATGGVRLTVAAQGGVDIESLATSSGAIHSATAAPRLDDLTALASQLTASMAPHIRTALSDTVAKLGRIFLETELLLLEINPLFVHRNGTWIAGDAKIVSDDDALHRQPDLRAVLDSRRTAYQETVYKQEHGCDYVVVDRDGEIGLLTTGAGLSMMLIDELRASGLKPYNFLDVRTGGLRGDPTRLVNVLEKIAEGERVRVLLVNIFAGITDLAEFARLLSTALERVPHFKAPVVARLAGTNLAAAREYLAPRGIAVVTELGIALDHVRARLAS
jgi:succinyl-CoA synthetase beta subunit